jgi:AbiV family abortive infection protein
MSRRNYRNNLEFIEAGFKACWHNTRDLVKGAKVLLDSSLHAPALSVSVLAIEELGKLICIDGLLFARTDDHKAEAFAKSLRSHSVKLSALEAFPLLLGHIAAVDPRYKTELPFRQTIAIGISDLKERGNCVLSLLEDGSFHGLDQWKQSGFYSQPKGRSFVSPAEAVKRDISEAVYMLAWRASSMLDFLLKRGNLERYIGSARGLRSKLSDEDHRAIENLSERVFADLFPRDA